MKLVQVWIEYRTLSLDRPFTYASTLDGIMRGVRVEINFNGRPIVGFVDSYEETDETLDSASERLGYRLGVIERVIDIEPLIEDELYELSEWMAYECAASRISCFQTMLPAKLKPKNSGHRIKMEKWVQLSEKVQEKFSPKQKVAYEALQDGPMSLKSFTTSFGSAALTLIKNGIVMKYEVEVSAKPQEKIEVVKNHQLTKIQSKAKESIEQCQQTAVLLHGVTGSGKTEVYLQMAQEVVKHGKQVLILVPEISLTPQMVKRVQSRFGSQVAIYHSGLNNQEKYEQFKRAKAHEVDIVVGTRSAVFMPFKDLGLIIFDEEHDSSYKQDRVPTYHCRDISIWRANYHGCKVILGSATPCLDSYARALKGVYGLVSMSERINECMPDVQIVDVKNEVRNKGSYILSTSLLQKMQVRLDRQEQIVLLLNRRGYSPSIRCKACNEAMMCPHCEVQLSFHRSDNTLKCHRCDYQQPTIQACPHCGNRTFNFVGIGTQRLEEEVQKAFPHARIARMDADTTARKNAHQKIFELVEKHEVDILLGTQIIAKGMDYPNVTLVGVVNADAGLNRPDFYAVENTFQLIVQAAGRSGRGEKAGEVVIQTFDPNHYAIVLGARMDFMNFFKKEMSLRHLTMTPPYNYLISILMSFKDEERTKDEAYQICDILKAKEAFKVLGPSQLYRVQDLYRFRIVIKGKDKKEMLEAIHEILAYVKSLKMRSEFRVDTNPMMLE